MKQLHLIGSWVIKAPREEVYKIISDFENMPINFPSVAQSLKIVEKQENTLTIEAIAKSFGSTFPITMKTVLQPPVGFISDNINHKFNARGHEEFLMEETPDGTRINYSYEYDISNSNVLLRIVAKPLLAWFGVWFWKRAVIDKLKIMLEKSE
jgi:hypothetical protein